MRISPKNVECCLFQRGFPCREEFRAAFTGMTGRRLGEQELDSLMSMFDADGNEMIDQVQCGKLTDNFNVCMSNLRSFKGASCTGVHQDAMRGLVYHLRERERRHSY